MSENERLLKWMEETDFDTNMLADALGVSYSMVYMQTRGGRPVSAEMKWQFACRFGMAEAARVFDLPTSAEPIAA